MPIAFGNKTLDNIAVVASRNLTLNDFGRTLVNSSSTGYNLTLQTSTNAVLPIGTEIKLQQVSTGQLFFLTTSPITVNGTNSITMSQYSSIHLRKIANEAWVTV